MSSRNLCRIVSWAATGLMCLSVLPAFSATRDEIAFANHGGIRDWSADGTRGIWVQARGGQWYYAKFSFPCTGLPFTTRLKFKTGPFGELDKWGAVNTRYDRCNFVDFKASDRPLRKRDRKAATAALAAAPSTQTRQHVGGG